MAFLTPADWLSLALDGSDQDCMARVGLSRTRVVHRALVLSRDPDVALEYPLLVQRVRERLAAGERRRTWPADSALDL